MAQDLEDYMEAKCPTQCEYVRHGKIYVAHQNGQYVRTMLKFTCDYTGARKLILLDQIGTMVVNGPDKVGVTL